MATKEEARAERLHLRLSPTDDGLIRAAAAASQLSITEFVVRAARASAAAALADREHAVLGAAAWDELDREVERAGQRREGVAELFRRSSPFQQ